MSQIQYTTSECGFAAMGALTAQMHAQIAGGGHAERGAAMGDATMGARVSTATAQAHARAQERALRTFLPL